MCVVLVKILTRHTIKPWFEYKWKKKIYIYICPLDQTTIYNPYTKNTLNPLKFNQLKRKNELMLTKPARTILKLCGSLALVNIWMHYIMK